MALSDSEKDAFRRDGVITRRAAFSPDVTALARQLIGDWYRDHLDASRVTEYTQRTFAPDLGSHPALLSLLTATGAWDTALDLLGEIAPVTTAQIQIRIPGSELASVQPVKAMHVDGVSCPHLDPAELRTFSLLVGIPLSDVTSPDGGALHYLPGGHLRMSRWFATEWSLGITDQVPPAIDAETGTPFLGSIGDVLLMHHLVPHAVGTNNTGTPRVMAYFRLSHPGHASRRLDALRDPWLDYPPLAR
jgi:hypothetical protein